MSLEVRRVVQLRYPQKLSNAVSRPMYHLGLSTLVHEKCFLTPKSRQGIYAIKIL